MEESSTPDLDRIDLRILRALHAEGRLTNAELAARVNVSPATCHRRTQRLFETGCITGVRAMGAHGGTPCPHTKEVQDCNLVAGDFDYLLKIRVRDMADFNRLHARALIALPGVRQTRTFFVMKEVKENGRLPF